jgi:ABC-type amino acid transport substrate-binding protein
VAGDSTLRAVGEPLNHLGYHVGVRSEDADLLARVQAAVKAMAADGETDAIRRKWEAPAAPR